jgi:thiol:disulfide interchange protein
MPEFLNRLRVISVPVRLLVGLAIFVAAGSAYATDETLPGPAGSSAAQPSGTSDRDVGAKTSHAARERTSSVNIAPRFAISAQTAPPEQTPLSVNRHRLLKVIELYLYAGLLVGVLPGLLPAASILSAVVANGGVGTTVRHALLLSSSYVAGTALIHTIVGLSIARHATASGPLPGHPLWVALFAAIVVAFAVRLKAGNHLRIPLRWQRPLANIPVRMRKAGAYLGVATLGMLSSLVLSADLTARFASRLAWQAPLDGAFATAIALLAMSLGLGLPLLAIGTGVAAVLNRAGPWRDGVKVYIAIELLASALLVVWPLLDPPLRVGFGSSWLLVAVAELGLLSSRGHPGTIWREPGRGLAAALAIWTTLLLAVPVSRPVEPQLLLQRVNVEGRAPVASIGGRLANASSVRCPPCPPTRTQAAMAPPPSTSTVEPVA